MRRWRMEKKCADCPFDNKGEGLQLRRSLREGRWKNILKGLMQQEHFICHETTRETGNGSNLVCAGSIEWQDGRGVSAQYVRVCERMEALTKRERD